MIRVYISYQLRPSAALAKRITDHLHLHGMYVWVDVERIERQGYFPERLRQGIATSDVFICLVADTTFQSGLVRREIAHAQALGKPMLPVFQESYQQLPQKPPPPDPAVAALLQRPGVRLLDRQDAGVNEDLEKLAQMVEAMVEESHAPRPFLTLRRTLSYLAGAVAVVAVAALVIVALFQAAGGLRVDQVIGGDGPSPTAPSVGPTAGPGERSTQPPATAVPPTGAGPSPAATSASIVPTSAATQTLTLTPSSAGQGTAGFESLFQTATALADVAASLPTPRPTPLGGGTGLVAFDSRREGTDTAIYVLDAACLRSACDDRLAGRLDTGGSAESPAWSPDGRRIAFVSARTGNRDVFIMDADGSNLFNLTAGLTGGADDFQPAWSPDGAVIAFVSEAGGAAPDIYVVNADGADLRRLTSPPAADDSPAWSPAGDRLAFSSARDGDRALYEVEVACLALAEGCDRYVRRLTAESAGSPAWSPDGRRIAFRAGGDGDIYVLDADGGAVYRVTDHPAADDWPAWSPDGRWLMFQSERGGNWDLQAVETTCLDSVDTAQACESGLIRLTTGAAPDQHPSWAPPPGSGP